MVATEVGLNNSKQKSARIKNTSGGLRRALPVWLYQHPGKTQTSRNLAKAPKIQRLDEVGLRPQSSALVDITIPS